MTDNSAAVDTTDDETETETDLITATRRRLIAAFANPALHDIDQVAASLGMTMMEYCHALKNVGLYYDICENTIGEI